MNRIHSILIAAGLLLAAGLHAAPKRPIVPEVVEAATVISDFRQALEADEYLCDAAMRQVNDEASRHIAQLQNSKDRSAYSKTNDLMGFLVRNRDVIKQRQEQLPEFIDEFIARYKGKIIEDSIACRDSLTNIVSDKLGALETGLNRLEREMSAPQETEQQLPLLWVVIGGGVLLVVIIWLIARSRKKDYIDTPAQPVNNTNSGPSNNGEPGIVVRRKTATILKKQSLEDVMDNLHYMKVDLEDCCYESAVRRMYIKDSCVEELYDMYKDDAADPTQAREYGCMILGRWVQDAENDEYYVSLEHIVLPGDDAVFEEYELNFGGKIKLRVLELLRKLRRETNLQYDLTCWVHSHPGLSVFFSNADSSVQDQLKHPQHPRFLTAIVVDTLTPGMETGIFTYHRDMTLNSKNDLKKLYSLEEWHKWAETTKDTEVPVPAVEPELPLTAAVPVAPEAPAVPEGPTFNALFNAKERTSTCYAISLTRELAQDISMALTSPATGIIGTIHGQATKQGENTVCTAAVLSNRAQETGQDAIGCLITANHRSIPSLRKELADRLARLRFVLVYTPSDGLLTSVPVVAGDLCQDENYYGEQGIETLKKWIKKN